MSEENCKRPLRPDQRSHRAPCTVGIDVACLRTTHVFECSARGLPDDRSYRIPGFGFVIAHHLFPASRRPPFGNSYRLPIAVIGAQRLRSTTANAYVSLTQSCGQAPASRRSQSPAEPDLTPSPLRLGSGQAPSSPGGRGWLKQGRISEEAV